MKTKKIKKTVIILGYSCNNHCLFCIDHNKRGYPEKPTQQVIQEMWRSREAGTKYLELIGGEVFIKPDAVSLISAAKRIGFETISVTTNGRMLAYRDFAKEIIDAGLSQIIFSIHGHNSALHDLLTGIKGSFKQLCKGIENVRSLGFRQVGSNTTIVKQNYKFLAQIGGFIYKSGIRSAEFIFVDPTYGGAHDNFNKMVPSISECAPFIRKCLEFGKKKRISHWAARYVPLCYFPGYEKQISELNDNNSFFTEHLAPDFKNLDVEGSRKDIGRIKTQACKGCAKFDICEGIWVEYYKRRGDKELVAVR